MFDYRFTRDAEEYTAKLRKEALHDRLARSAQPRLAKTGAQIFRSWATRLEVMAAKRAEASSNGWSFDEERHEAQRRSRPWPYADA